MQTAHTQKGMTKLIPIIVVVAVLIAGGAYYAMSMSPSAVPPTPAPTPAPVTPPVTTTTPPPATTASASGFKDGTFTAEGSYKTPEDVEKITVSLTIKDGVVTDSTVTQTAANQKSVLYQDVFSSGYKEFVTGKKLADLKIGVVSGASLTGAGFNEAVAKIATQAKA
jgi:uncharacterized protein with FMN-binding domain